ncbi:protein NUCLEAR FUSION DEFECTIVE 6, chloroplastic/mitochondrial isoform X3 [Gossypium australe]|uniref:Protein NUCLEAR FUSION DEFECTIVE 6, chloroplastic/mitochondrial isoform X3 n=1 Tax=Gossypium australe TaxID=47621 RepID=A0A5B6WQ84_9ROSI|nr:protein NUCLEAR FUSION DEFECTIVE 6, chloroplastic/mitochondrial isoform X3 [Gossypium australe]
MAATCGRRTLGFSCSSAKTIFTHLPSSTPANNKLPGLFSPNKISASRFSLRNLTFSRLPVEMGVLRLLLCSLPCCLCIIKAGDVCQKDLQLLYSIAYVLLLSMLLRPPSAGDFVTLLVLNRTSY